jgi:hypothetical protein
LSNSQRPTVHGRGYTSEPKTLPKSLIDKPREAVIWSGNLPRAY